MDKALDDIIAYHKSEEDDYYNILGCNENSTSEQITAEYKSRVLSCHPDKQQDDDGAHDKFSKLSQAKNVLLDPEKRREYDKWRHSGIAIPFETWQSLAHVKTSMHWGYCKEQPAIGHEKKPEYRSQHRLFTPSNSGTQQDKGSQELKDKLKFTPREKSAKTDNTGASDWERNTSNPLLQKFRNYEI